MPCGVCKLHFQNDVAKKCEWPDDSDHRSYLVRHGGLFDATDIGHVKQEHQVGLCQHGDTKKRERYAVRRSSLQLGKALWTRP